MLDVAIKTSSVTFEWAISLKWAWQKPGTREWWREEKYRVYFVRFNNSDKDHNERSGILNKGLRIPCAFPPDYRWSLLDRSFCGSASHPITFQPVTEKKKSVSTSYSEWSFYQRSSKCQAPGCWQTPTSPPGSGIAPHIALSRSCGYRKSFFDLNTLFLIIGFIYKINLC